MAQIKTFSWTNANPAVVRTLDIGFTVAEILTIDVTNGGSFQWVTGMPSGYYLDVDAGTITTSNGFTPVAQNTSIGATISGFTNANPGVLTVSNTAIFGFAVGDTISVVAVADDGTATSLNGEYTIASLTATTITTATNTTAYSAYVSGGYVTRISDVNGTPIPIENYAIRGMTIGSGVIGGASAAVVCVVKGQESVV